jgi:hypothetical protein
MTLQERKDKKIYSQKHQKKNIVSEKKKHKDRQKKFEPKKQNN